MLCEQLLIRWVAVDVTKYHKHEQGCSPSYAITALLDLAVGLAGSSFSSFWALALLVAPETRFWLALLHTGYDNWGPSQPSPVPEQPD